MVLSTIALSCFCIRPIPFLVDSHRWMLLLLGQKNWNTAVDAHGHIDRMSLSAAPRPSSLHLLPPNPSLANISEDSCRRIDFKHHHRMVLKVIGSHLQLDCNPRKVKSMHPSQAYIKKIQVVPKCTPCSITEKVLTADCGNAQHERKQRKWGYKSVCSVPTVKVPFPFPQNMFGEHVLSTLEIFPERTAVRAGETLSVEIQCQSLQKVCRIFVAVAVRNTYFYRRSICCGGRMRKEPIQVADHFYLQSSLMQEVNQKRTYSGIGPYQHGLFNVIGTKVNIVIPQDITSTQLRLVAPGLVAPPQSKRVMCRQTFELYVEALGNVTSGAPSAASSSSSSSVPCFRSIVTSVAALSLLPFQ